MNEELNTLLQGIFVPLILFLLFYALSLVFRLIHALNELANVMKYFENELSIQYARQLEDEEKML